MKTKTLLVSIALTLASLSVCLAGDEQALRDLDAQWAAAAKAKDLDKTVSFYTDDATVLPPNAPTITTKDGVRKVWKDMFDMPGFALTWQTTKVITSKSGDVGYAIGTYQLTANDASGKPGTHKGKYLEVFEKKAGGQWKCTADMFNMDEPEPPAK